MGERNDDRARRALTAAAVAVVAALQLLLVFRVNFNWDEFHYLSFVYAARRGDLADPWQSFHVHLLGWLTRLPGHEADQIVAGRLVGLAAEALAAFCLYRLARRFLAPRHAFLALATLLSSGYVLRHAFSLRPDPLCTALAMVAALLAVGGQRRPRLTAAVAGSALALALAISLKAVVLAAAVAGILAVRWAREGSWAAARRLLWCGAVAALGFVAMWTFHRAGLAPRPAADAARASLGAIAATVLGTGRLFPGWSFLAASLRQSPLLWLCVLGGIATVGGRCLGRARAGSTEAALLPLAIPLATLAVYRNAFPYYYVFVLVPAAVFAGLFLRDLEGWLRRRSNRLATAAVVLLWGGTTMTFATQYLANLPDRTAAQRQLLDVVHQLFPEPVPYIDRCSMVSSFPKVGFFMSTWGMRNYWSLGRPIMEELLRREQPVLLVANSPGLELGYPEHLARRAPYALRPEDRQTLREHFVHHWGLLWLAGKRLTLPASGAERFEILVEGPYTLEATGLVRVDGVDVAPGDVLHLRAGHHEIAAGRPGESVVLRWGERLAVPPAPPLHEPLFTGL